MINNWRWSGVPFYLRTGKRMKSKTSEITVKYKSVPHNIFSENSKVSSNQLVLRIHPDEGIDLKLNTKEPGVTGFNLEELPLDLNLDDSVSIVNYGAGTVCGGSVHSFKGNPYRSFEGGVASLKADLTINESTLIGNYEAQNVYSVETIGDKVYVGTYDGYVKILSEDNIEISSYQVGSFPGDFEVWKK